MNAQLKKKIVEDIKATGFPTELEVAHQLRNSQWTVEQNGTYYDLESNKSREIDIEARKVYSFNNKNVSFYFAINLIIEVKKTTKRPWVFFTIPNTKDKYSDFLGPAFGILTHMVNLAPKKLTPKEFMQYFPRNKEPEIATSFYEAFKSPDEPSKIYEAVLSAIKAAFHARRMETSEDLFGENELEEINSAKFNQKAAQRFEVYIPVVVVDGTICGATVKPNKDIELKEKSFVPISISHSVKPYSNFDYYPDIVSVNYFSNYLLFMEEWGNSITDVWKT